MKNITAAETPAENRLSQHPSIKMRKALESIIEIVSAGPTIGEDVQKKLQKIKDEVCNGLKNEPAILSWPSDTENALKKIEENLDADPSIPKMRAALEAILTTVDTSFFEEQDWNKFQDLQETARIGLIVS